MSKFDPADGIDEFSYNTGFGDGVKYKEEAIKMSNHWQNSFDRHLVLSQISELIKVQQDKLALIRIQEESRQLPDEMDQLSYHTGRLWALEDLKAQIETNNKIIEVI